MHKSAEVILHSAPPMATSRYRNVCFTLYQEPPVIFDEACVRYVIWGCEVCPSTGRPHLQGYLELKNPRGINAIKAILHSETVHIEPRRGTAKQAIDYCKKDGKWTEWGEPSQQGRRSDWDQFRNDCESMSFREAALQNIRLYGQYTNGCQKIYQLVRGMPRKDKTEVRWYYGPTGTGKSRLVHEMHPVYYSKNETRWWDGYENEEVVIIDEFDSKHIDNMGISYILRLFDRYPMKVEVKGGTVEFNSKLILITSHHHPRIYFPEGRIEELLRRIELVHMTERS